MDELEKNYRQAVLQLDFMLSNDDSIDIQDKKLWCQHLLEEYKQIIENASSEVQLETQSELTNCINTCKK